PRDKRLLVLALLGSGDDIRLPLKHRPHQRWDVLGEVLQVGGIEYQHVAAGYIAGGAEGIRDATLAPMSDDSEEGVLPFQLAEYVGQFVPRPVVHHDDFEPEP